MMIRVAIHPNAGEQFVPISSTYDINWGEARFVLSDGVTSFMPVIVPGGVYYQAIGVDEDINLPSEVSLGQNYPNPFNMKTGIDFAVPSPGHVSLELYDILGRQIKTLIDANLEPGYYTAGWDGLDESGNPVSTGMYFYTLKTGDSRLSRKMLLLK